MINRFIPNAIGRVLWGDREKFGLVPDTEDSDWHVWLEKGYTDFYQNTQQTGIGNLVNNMVYPVVRQVDVSGKRILELGPGIIRHLEYMVGRPKEYVVCDIDERNLVASTNQLRLAGYPCSSALLNRSEKPTLPFPDSSFDVFLSFNSLEHLNPLDVYVNELSRVLRPGGYLVGGVPCEGGLAWGVGRYLTTRRYVHSRYGINYDKIICWEHPNFVDTIVDTLDNAMNRRYLCRHPFSMLPYDLNLMVSFVYERK